MAGQPTSIASSGGRPKPSVVDGKATRVRFQTAADGSKVRVAARGGKVLSTIRKAEAKK